MNQSDTTAANSGINEPAAPAPNLLDPASITRLLALIRETLETTVAKALARFEAPANPPTPSPTSTGIDLRSSEKAADLRFGLLTWQSS